MFALALVKCFNGGACLPDEPLVTIEKLFQELKIYMNELHDLAEMNVVLVGSKSEKRKIENGAEADDTSEPAPNADADAGAVLAKTASAANGIDEEEAPKEQEPKQRVLPKQSPVLVLPRRDASVLDNAVCCRCGPPCAPDRPYVRISLYCFCSAVCDYFCLLVDYSC